MRIAFALFFVLTGVTAFAQDCDSTQWAQPGTYTVEVDSNAFEGTIATPIMLSGRDLCFIEANRKPLINNQVHIGIYLVTIFPKEIVTGPFETPNKN